MKMSKHISRLTVGLKAKLIFSFSLFVLLFVCVLVCNSLILCYYLLYAACLNPHCKYNNLLWVCFSSCGDLSIMFLHKLIKLIPCLQPTPPPRISINLQTGRLICSSLVALIGIVVHLVPLFNCTWL